MLVDYAQKFPVHEGKVGHGGTSHAHEMRRSAIRWLPRHDANLRWLFDRVALNALQVNRTAFHLELSEEPHLRFTHAQFTEYKGAGRKMGKPGKYDWHEDNCWLSAQPRAYDRKLSCVIQLSKPTAYHGGKLEFDAGRAEAQLKGDTFTLQGDMIFFPSHLRHRVTPVTAGTRHSLVFWFEGPPLR